MTEEQERVMKSGISYAEYSGQNIAVFPVDISKHPCTPHGFLDAESEPEKVKRLFESHPNFAGVAIATGQRSHGLFVLDLDRNHGSDADGVETARSWEMQNGDFPQTWTASTPSGGEHLYFLGSGNEKCVRNGKDGVDLRATGGYAILPPSRNKDGVYFWDLSPSEVKLAKPNASVLGFMEAYCRPAEQKQRLQLPETIGQGCREWTLYRAACSMQRTGFSDEAIRAAIEAENETACSPPLEDKELRQLIGSALKREKGGQLGGWMDMGKQMQMWILDEMSKELDS